MTIAASANRSAIRRERRERAGRDLHELGPGDDRGERPVEVAHDRGRRGVRQQRSKLLPPPIDARFRSGHGHLVSRRCRSRPRSGSPGSGSSRAHSAASSGSAAAPSWCRCSSRCGYGERRATATSLCAIVVIAALAAAVQAGYGNIDPGHAALLAVPAVIGVGLGVALQQRISERTVSLLFALLLIAVAIELAVP